MKTGKKLALLLLVAVSAAAVFEGRALCADELNSLLFDGENYIMLPNSSVVFGENPEGMTVALRVKFFDLSEDAYITGGSHGRPFDIYVRGGRWIRVRLNGVDSEGSRNDRTLSARVRSLDIEKWYHICFTYCFEKGKLNVFLDGEEVLAQDDVGVTGPTHLPLRLGRARRYSGLKNQQYDARMYKRALGGDEVRDVYNNAPVDETGLAGHWKMDEGEGTGVADSSGNEHHGTLGPGDSLPVWSRR